jgi:hypothetical protein
MPEPPIKRYALVPNAGQDGVTRFHLARVASRRGTPGAQRLERMEEIAALERRPEPPSRNSGPPEAA